MKKFTLLILVFFGLFFQSNAQLSGTRQVPSEFYPDFSTIADSLNLYGVGQGGISFYVSGGSVFTMSPVFFSATGSIDSPVYIGWDGIGQKPELYFTGSSSDSEAGIMLLGVSHYTIDGFSIHSPGSDIEYGIFVTNSDASTGSHFNTIRNMDIELDKYNTHQTEGIRVAAQFVAEVFEGNNHYNKFYNNSISDVTIGYVFNGNTSNTSLMCVGNEVNTYEGGQSKVSDIVMAGVLIQDQNGFVLSNTLISDLTRIGSGTTAPAGVSTSSGNPSDPLDHPFILSHNQIEDLSSDFTSVYGFYLSARKADYYVHSNKVHNVTATGGGGNTADGIMVLGTAIEAYIYNNMISGIAAPASALNGNAVSRGISVRTYSHAYVYYNSVLLDYQATNPQHHSAAFTIYNNSDPVEMRNNIFINKTVFDEGSQGIAAAFYKRTASLTNVLPGTNNNIYYSGTPDSQHVIFYGHHSSSPGIDQTLESYQERALVFDQQSYTEDVPFVSNDDLHIEASSSTIARSHAVAVEEPISITVDYDGMQRDPDTPDIGADEISYSYPYYAHTPQPADGQTSVLVSLPALSWEYESVSGYPDPEVFLVYLHESPDFGGLDPIAIVEWESGVNSYTATLLEPLDYLTTYYWQVVPSAEPSGNLIPPDIPIWSFTTEEGVELPPLTGTRQVPSEFYPDFSTIADSLNMYGVGQGGISFYVSGGSVFTMSPVFFSATGSIDSPVYIGWDGIGQKPELYFTGSSSDSEAGIMLLGVSHYTIDGFSIHSPGSDIEYGIFVTNSDASTGSHSNTIRNMDIELDKYNTHQTEGIRVAAQFVAEVFEGNNHYNKFYNNSISDVTIGYVFNGNTSNTSLMCVGNEVNTYEGGQSKVSDIVMAGVLIQDQNGFVLSNTLISDLTRIGSGTTAPAGVSTSSGNPSDPLDHPFILSHNQIEDLSSDFTSVYGFYLSARKADYYVHSNKVHNVTATGGGGNTADGIMVLGTAIEAYIYNNMISGIAAPASALNGNAVSRGISVRTYSHAYVYYNSVLLDYQATNPQHHSAAFTIYNNSDPVEMRNNIFINKTVFDEGSQGIAAAFYKRTASLTNVLPGTNNNIYYSGTPDSQHVIFYGHHSSSPGIDQTLESYQERALVFDQQSYTEDVPFVSNDDLHIEASSSTIARSHAVAVIEPVSITVDYDGMQRDPDTPDIGADEISYSYPYYAHTPQPADGQSSVLVSLPALSWEYESVSGYPDPEVFLVYLHDSPDFGGLDPIAIVEWESGVNSYTATLLEPLDYSTTYYWQIVPSAEPSGNLIPPDIPIWSFSTEAFVYPYPNTASDPDPDGSDPVSVELPQLGWSFTPELNYSLPSGFKVYIGLSSALGETDYLGWVSFVSGQTSYNASLSGFALDYSTAYYWKVVPTVDAQSGPDAQGVEVWSFTTEAFVYPYPNTASDPDPDGSDPVSVELLQLGWSFTPELNYSLPSGFKVYIGLSSALGETDYLGWVSFVSGQTSYNASLSGFALDYSTAYYWKVVPTVDAQSGPDAQGVEVWSFTTEAFVYPYPNTASDPDPDGSDPVSVELLQLGWSFTPELNYSLPSGFKVYIGLSSALGETDYLGWVSFVSGQTSYNASLSGFALDYSTAYYWKVVPTVDAQSGPDAQGVEVWSFTT
ncbi:MAG: right-handed parallel beta-helix repeat-containing protein, partial [Bacteroidales bacterium]|nr:right-handed parallel beta-helix repeat-containing protein [Bacteroidales bacterium]